MQSHLKLPYILYTNTYIYIHFKLLSNNWVTRNHNLKLVQSKQKSKSKRDTFNIDKYKLHVQSTTQNELRNSLGQRIINADLIITGRHHHQRDLFTGSLGIPDVTTHVGSVIHAFETMARNRTHQEQQQQLADQQQPPYEVSTGSVLQTTTTPFKQSHDSKLISNHHNHNSGSENRQRLVVITKAPAPPIPIQTQSSSSHTQHRPARHHSRRSRDSFSHSPSPPLPPQTQSKTTMTSAMQLHYESGGHTLPHVRHPSHPSSSAAPTVHATATSGTQTLHVRHNRAVEPPYEGIDDDNSGRDEPDSNNFDSIDMDDYRKNLFGTQTKIDARMFQAAGAGTMSTHLQPPNGHDKSRRRQPEIYLVKNDNNYMVAAGEHNTSNNYHNNNQHTQNSNSNNSQNISNNNNNNALTRNDVNSNLPVDDRALLRGTTVSQSFIKNVRTPSRKISENSSTSNGFRRGGDSRQSEPMASRNYFNTSTSTFKPTSDMTDELRMRYTEHNADTIMPRRNLKSGMCALHPNNRSGAGTTGRRQKHFS